MNDRYQQLKDRLSPPDVARRFGGTKDREVKRTASGYAVRCPVHDDEHPSAVIFENGGWHCSGCGAGGSILDFVAWFIVPGFNANHHLTPSDLALIEEKFNLTTYAPRPATRITELPQVEKVDFSSFTAIWQQQLFARADLMRYLGGRGILQPDMHGLGFVGGTVEMYHDMIAIPFHCCDAWKFRADPSKEIRHRFLAAGQMTRPYGFQRVRMGLTRAVVTVEGELDAAALNELLPPWAAALARPAHGWKKEDALSLWFVPHIYDCPDNDEPGQLSHRQKLEYIPRTRGLFVPSGYKDVGEYFTAGRQAVIDLIRPILEMGA